MNLSKNEARKKRKIRIRKKLSGTGERPRLCVFRSNRHIYAQIINDETGSTLVASSSQVLEGDTKLTKENAFKVGKDIADKAKAKQIESVVFDRNGFFYHGQVKSLAEGAREGGLKF
ncbi:MAG: 50S ribosomal protein L18 [Desulfovibrionales bacterium]